LLLSCIVTGCAGQEKIVVPTAQESIAVIESAVSADGLSDAASEEMIPGLGESEENISASQPDVSTSLPKESAVEPEPEEPPAITIRMVGDILLHDRVSQYALQEDGRYDYSRVFEDLKDEISEADLAIVNQEVIIAGEEFGVSGYPTFNAPFALGDALAEAGFDVICHGTNHALDKGKKGLLSCIDFWEREYPQLAVLGIHDSRADRNRIYVYEQDGIRVAVLNYTYGTNGIPLPADMPYAVDLLEREQVIADIHTAEALADFTIVCPHWGAEYVLEETAEQRQWAELFLECGVDLVLGTHPHVIEPVEMMVDEENGRQMLVYYSVGNFVNWTSSAKAGVANRMVGGMADVTIGRSEDGDVTITDYSVTAVVTHLESRTNGVYTTKLADYTQERSLENEIVLQDPAFSYEYCVELCDRIWGDLWK
jgi:poly-gamma-glutamate synthesis protein (capsule biosynthesis protein)